MNNVSEFSDVRVIPSLNRGKEEELVADYQTLSTLNFNLNTKFSDKCANDAKDILEKGKNPGLNIRKIHNDGITGQGINVAIIDQPLLLEHSEYKDKVIKYKNFDEDGYENESSEHGPAVLSLLAGNNIGVAPGVKVFYAAVPSWKKDMKYFEQALNWIIEENNKLDELDKIKVVSISADPAYVGSFDNPEKYDEFLERWTKIEENAFQNNILVISCTQNRYNILPGYLELDTQDSIDEFKIGFPYSKNVSCNYNTLFVPSSKRTVAEMYENEKESYSYEGPGGLSWGIPYLCGCLALGWQINYNLTPDQIMNIIFETAKLVNDNIFIINPTNFIENVKTNQYAVKK